MDRTVAPLVMDNASSRQLIVTTVDYHTAGEPFRIVSGGVHTPVGDSVVNRRDWARQHLDHVRRLLINEPRGHADMYGCFVTPPDDQGAHLGAVFFHNDGYSTACGHGTIALATWAVDSGLVSATDGAHAIVIDVPSGRVAATADIAGGEARWVRVANVPSHVEELDVELQLDGAVVHVDLAYGGAFYATLDVTELGLGVDRRNLSRLIELGRAVKAAVEATRHLEHPDGPHLSGVYGVVLYEPVGDGHQRNVAVFADGEVDRSPCGSGTSARLAILAEQGELTEADRLVHESIIGTQFIGRITGSAERHGRRTWGTEVAGRAARTGYHTFVLDPEDELGTGFLLR